MVKRKIVLLTGLRINLLQGWNWKNRGLSLHGQFDKGEEESKRLKLEL